MYPNILVMVKRDIKKENSIIKEMVEKIDTMPDCLNSVGKTKADYIVILTTIEYCWYKRDCYDGRIEWDGKHGYDFTEFDEPIIGDMCNYVHGLFDSLDHFSSQMKETVTAARKIAESVLKQIEK